MCWDFKVFCEILTREDLLIEWVVWRKKIFHGNCRLRFLVKCRIFQFGKAHQYQFRVECKICSHVTRWKIVGILEVHRSLINRCNVFIVAFLCSKEINVEEEKNHTSEFQFCTCFWGGMTSLYDHIWSVLSHTHVLGNRCHHMTKNGLFCHILLFLGGWCHHMTSSYDHIWTVLSHALVFRGLTKMMRSSYDHIWIVLTWTFGFISWWRHVIISK